MRFLNPRSFIALMTGVFTAFGSSAQNGSRQGEWAHETSDLSPHSAVQWGQLDNGFRYALMPHDGVPEAATLQLLVLAGSLDEADGEGGLAHFMEHMAFRGNQSFPVDEMEVFFQELGIEFGSDINAVTAFDHTAYTLDFREATAPLLERGLALFRSFADGVVFEPADIEQERGVILSELRGRDNIGAKGQYDSLEALFEGLKFVKRSPGGSYESVAALTLEQFESFYRRFYRPDLMVLVGAGDIDVSEMVALVGKHFGSMTRPTAPIPQREVGELSQGDSLRADTFRISNVGAVQVVVGAVSTPSTVADSRALREDAFAENLVQNLLSERLSRGLANVPGGSARLERLVGNRAAMAMMTTRGEAWRKHLQSLDELIRATHRYGFKPDEIDSARDRMKRMGELMTDLIPRSDPNEVSQMLLDSIVEHQVFVGAAVEMQWRLAWLASLDADQLLATFRRLWQLDNLVVHFSGDLGDELKPADILTEWQKHRDIEVEELQFSAVKEHRFELKDWGEPGDYELVREVPEIGAKLYRLENGVRVNIVSTPFEPGVVHAVARVGSGLVDMPGNKPALKEFGLRTLFASGTTHYMSDEMGKIIGSQFLNFDFGVKEHDAFTFTGVAEPNDLTAFLGVVTEFLYKPKFGTYVHRSQKMQATMSRASTASGMGEGMRDLTDYLFEGDARFTWGNFVDYVGLSSIDVKRWLQEPLSEGYTEVTIVGDISIEDALAGVQRTLGALRPRAEEKKPRTTPKPVKISAPPGFKRIEFVGEDHLAVVMGHWPVEEELSTRDRGAVYLLAKILELHIRSEIRNDLGLAYSPTASFEAYNGFSEFSMLTASVDCASGEATRIARMVEDIATELSRRGIDEGEFRGARGILSSQIRRAWEDNGYLVRSLLRAQERPESVEELQALHAGMVDEITLKEVEAWAKKILTRRNTRTSAIVPKQFIGLFETD
ncbi:insulinase family protein [Opitutaceae bacterium]|nr:insulinase family protein [Opitutaceae bacterium]MDB4473455.1 insulinase family protein [Opitutaceae bacterium]